MPLSWHMSICCKLQGGLPWVWRVASSGGSYFQVTSFLRGSAERSMTSVINPVFVQWGSLGSPKKTYLHSRKHSKKKTCRSSVVFHQDGGKLRVPLGTLETHGRACDASMNLEDLQIPFIQVGDLLLHLVLLRVHNWECPISRFFVDSWYSIQIDHGHGWQMFFLWCFHLHGNLSAKLVLDLFCTFKMVSKPISLM